ncbi:MAG: carboxylating nicotinate-nucleotide diphosphorylase [Cyclobacteriaceae bacterium]
MIPKYVTKELLDKIILDAIREDLGDGDHTTLAVIPEDKTGKARLVAKENGIIAGLDLAGIVYGKFNEEIDLVNYFHDGDPIKKGDIVFEASGNARDILSSERLVLNFMQRMSGISTYTRKLLDIIDDLPVKLLDTRKTSPNLRMLEKWAVLIGGGTNHRIGLYDMIMLKDNHVDLAGGIKSAVGKAAQYLKTSGKQLKIEVETRNLKEVEEAIHTGQVDIIMLDNMSVTDMKKAVEMIDGKIITEASGNVNENTIREIAECGVDFISVGALTHSIKSLDLSLLTKI